MKKIYFLIYFIYLVHPVFACDVCGCSSGGYFIGPFPQFSGHFVGLQYSFRNFNTVLKTDNSQFSRDFYQTAQLIAGTHIGNKWQMFMYLPFNVNHSVSDDGTSKSNGFGDITFLANYKLLYNKKLNRNNQTVFQQFWIGGGIKMPTGKFSVDTGEIVSSANMQPGTGSVDFLFDAIYSFQVRKWGLNVNASYKFNGDANHFKFGNRLSTTAFVFHSFHLAKVIASPNIGLLYDNISANVNKGEKVSQTGGNDLLSALGLEVRLKRIAIGCNVQYPIVCDLSAGQTNSKLQGMVHISFMF